MASIVLGMAGSAFAGPIGGMIGGALGSMIDNKIFNHRWIQKPNPWDLVVESAAFGTPIPVAYNRCLIAGNLIQSTNLIPYEHTGKGGKGGGGSKGGKGGQPYYTYSATFGILICRTTDQFGNNVPLKNIWRIYADSKLIWSRDPNDTTINTDNVDTVLISGYQPTYETTPDGTFEIGGVATIYEMNQSKNANSQSPAGSIQLWYGYETTPIDGNLLAITSESDSTPAYRGYAYMSFPGFPLQWFGNRIPQFKVEVNGWPSAVVTDLSVPPPTLPPGGADQTTYVGSMLSVSEATIEAVPTSLSTGLTYICDKNAITPVFNVACSVLDPVIYLNGVDGTIDPVIAANANYADGVTFAGGYQGPSGFDASSTLWASVMPYGSSSGGPGLLQVMGGQGVKQIFPLAGDGGTGLGTMSGSGLVCYCGNGLLFVSDNDTLFQVYDQTRPNANGNPKLALMGNFLTNVIYDYSSGAPVKCFQGSGGAGGYSSANSVAWSESRNELVVFDGNNSTQFVLTGNGSSPVYSSLTSMVGPVTRGVGNGLTTNRPFYVAYDIVNDVFLYQGQFAIHGFSDVLSSASVANTTENITACAYWGMTLANQPLAGFVAVASGTTMYTFTTGFPFLLTQQWSWSDALSTPNGPLLYNPTFAGSLNWVTFDNSGDDDSNGFALYSRALNVDDGADVVGNIMQQCGLTTDQFDLSALAALPLYGYFVGSEVSGRAAVEPLQEVYLFDLIDTGPKLVARFRQSQASSPAFILTETDLAARVLPEGTEPGAHAQPRFQERRKQDLMLPQQLTLRYRTASGSRYVQDFCMEIGSQYAKRNHATVGALGKITLNTPIVLTDAMAATLAEQVLYNQWLQRTDIEFTMPRKYLACEPGDVITFGFHDFDGNFVNYLIYVSEATIGADNTIQVKGMLTYPTVLIGSGISGGLSGGALPSQNGGKPPTPFSINLALLDIPPLQDSDDSPGLYWAASAQSSTTFWTGSLQRSIDGGQSYATIGTTATQAAIGTATTILGAWPSPKWDKTNSVTVRFFSTGTGLSSVSPEQVLSGKNVFLIGSEIIGAANCVLNADGTYTLSLLLRGGQGTDIFGGSHSGGEQVVRLGVDGSLNDFTETLGDIGITEDYALVSAGGSLATAVTRGETLSGARIKPEAAASAFVTRDVSNNATISWIPRKRIHWQWTDGPEAPYTDEAGGEAYSIDIYDSTPAVVRTITSFTSLTGTVGSQSGYDTGIRQATYSAAQQTADGLTPGDPINLSIYELSTRTGWTGTRGFARTITQ